MRSTALAIIRAPVRTMALRRAAARGFVAALRYDNAMPWAERLAWDVRYVETRSFALDCRIVLDTFKVVLKREGITEEGQVAMTDFEGAPDVEV